MKILPINRYRFFQRIQPVSLLKKITNKPVTGCLQVFTTSDSWSFYFEDSKLIYASCTDKMFNLLYDKLQQYSQQIPALAQKKVYQQLRVIFQKGIDNQAILNPDYLAICWLVNQKLITPAQAKILIKELAAEVLSSFLAVKQGSYEFTTESFMQEMPKFCSLDMNVLIENCENKSKNQENEVKQAITTPPSQYLNQAPSETKIPIQQPLPKAGISQVNNQSTNNSYNSRQRLYRQNYQNYRKKVYTIVCIDDSPTVLTAIESFLDEQIFSVVGFSEPLKALMQILRTNPDLILLDVEMPNLDGYELCSLLRKHSYFKDVPVIMVTGRKGFIDRAKAKMVRASGYLTKPFNQSELLKIIFQHLM
ncbi:CheY-like receiver domain-containing protein [Rivularia sp. PCC 7116]|uniref:response regulator n=1 Tax=Rivularia sp. PCC 7116 TaxID=373994 RepID=UPI00029EDA78|nr:response regulator [Rivularia sp. PCC 7116]AFY56028.1 CheY-like receiver domain-containing protein [Rivularia sp. PCC 7116]